MDFDWTKARAFLAVVDAGSLSAAARLLGQTQPTIGRQINALEAELDLVLFERVGRGLSLTPSGQSLVPHIRQMADAAERVALAASGQAHGIEGLVRISAADLIATHVLPAILVDIHARAPKLEIEIVATNSISDLLRREADIAVRHVRPEEPDLIAKLVSEDNAAICASKDYLDRFGRPQSRDDLWDHKFVGFGDLDEILFHFNRLDVPGDKDSFPTRSSNGVVAWNLMRKGLGLGIASERIIEDFPDVERVLPDYAPVSFPNWLIAHRELLVADRIRLVFEMLEKGIRRYASGVAR